MTRKGFTLLELLVVVGIMGLLGTASIGAYRSITRGMEERGALQNASQFMHAAFQRAMIDRQPTAVYVWNETLQSSTADENEIVVGKAVAVRRAGRITGVDGNYLQDEFADLNLTYPVNEGSQNGSTMFLYQLDNVMDGLKRSRVYDSVHKSSVAEIYLLNPVGGATEQTTGSLPAPSGSGTINIYGFEIENANGVTWEVGNAYGFEFMSLELPHNFIFGNSQGDYSNDISNPIAGEKKLVFGGGAGGYERRSDNVQGANTIKISALRQDQSGNIKPVEIGTTADPTEEAS